MKLKITTIGNSAGVILPRELLARLRVEKGDSLFATELPDGVKLGLVSLCVLLLVRLHQRRDSMRAAELALVGSAVAYSSLLVYHLTAVPGLVSAS